MKTIFFFILTAICVTTLFFSSNSFAQDSPQWHLPEGATARLGKGWLYEIQYSPDGTRLAAAGSLGVWIYDAATDEEIALFTGYGYSVSALTYSPDGSMLAGGVWMGPFVYGILKQVKFCIPLKSIREASAALFLVLMALCSPVAVEIIPSSYGILKQANF